jgi:transposase InsO family protein
MVEQPTCLSAQSQGGNPKLSWALHAARPLWLFRAAPAKLCVAKRLTDLKRHIKHDNNIRVYKTGNT